MIGLGSIISGALGGAFGIFQKWMDIKAEERKAIERAAERAHELDTIRLESEMADRRLQIQSDIAQTEAAGAAFVASQQYGNAPILPEGVKLSKNQTWWLVVIDAISRAVRPMTTIYYQLAMAGVFVWTATILAGMPGGGMTAENATTIQQEIIFAVLYLSEMTVGWWFGVSAIRPKRGR